MYTFLVIFIMINAGFLPGVIKVVCVDSPLPQYEKGVMVMSNLVPGSNLVIFMTVSENVLRG